MIYILKISHHRETDKWFFLWTNGQAQADLQVTREEAEGLLLFGVFQKMNFIPDHVQGWTFKKNGHMVKISAVTHQLTSNTWVACWSDPGTRGEFSITQAEADQLILYNPFTRGATGSLEHWFFKSAPLSLSRENTRTRSTN